MVALKFVNNCKIILYYHRGNYLKVPLYYFLKEFQMTNTCGNIWKLLIKNLKCALILFKSHFYLLAVSFL